MRVGHANVRRGETFLSRWQRVVSVCVSCANTLCAKIFANTLSVPQRIRKHPAVCQNTLTHTDCLKPAECDVIHDRENLWFNALFVAITGNMSPNSSNTCCVPNHSSTQTASSPLNVTSFMSELQAALHDTNVTEVLMEPNGDYTLLHLKCVPRPFFFFWHATQ